MLLSYPQPLFFPLLLLLLLPLLLLPHLPIPDFKVLFMQKLVKFSCPRSLLPGGTCSFLEHIYNFILSEKRNRNIKHGAFLFVPSLCLSSGTHLLFSVFSICVRFLSWFSSKPFFIFLNLTNSVLSTFAFEQHCLKSN